MRANNNFTKEQKIRFMFKSMLNNKINSLTWWGFIEGIDKNYLKSVIAPIQEAERRLFEYKNSFHYTTKIRKYCNLYLYSDVKPFEVVKVISDKCVEIREMTANLITAPKNFHPGGFIGNYSDNDAQEWECISNTENQSFKIRLSKKGWGLGKYHMSDTPINFYDYNF